MINILLFAGLQEKVGKESVQLDIEAGTIQSLRKQLKENYQLDEIDTAMAAINEEYATDESTVTLGDTVAFIPPVSGG
ncbi:molybdopterin converting factor subunit 1 [Thalassobacillus hwangdonensis]|uniref:Molybdopterin synthase sulfur carrier subunit n=1 Tax=Thalassobacillus hwangdonensis TaxID=546108 RepID=A0ABW3KZU5_9BACI